MKYIVIVALSASIGFFVGERKMEDKLRMQIDKLEISNIRVLTSALSIAKIAEKCIRE